MTRSFTADSVALSFIDKRACVFANHLGPNDILLLLGPRPLVYIHIQFRMHGTGDTDHIDSDADRQPCTSANATVKLHLLAGMNRRQLFGTGVGIQTLPSLKTIAKHFKED